MWMWSPLIEPHVISLHLDHVNPVGIWDLSLQGVCSEKKNSLKDPQGGNNYLDGQ